MTQNKLKVQIQRQWGVYLIGKGPVELVFSSVDKKEALDVLNQLRDHESGKPYPCNYNLIQMNDKVTVHYCDGSVWRP